MWKGLSGIMDFKSTNLVAFFISFLYHKQAFILKEKRETILKRDVCAWPFLPAEPHGYSLNRVLRNHALKRSRSVGVGNHQFGL